MIHQSKFINKYTGSADSVGLKRIGWTDSDIEFFQEHGVVWEAEDDDLFKVPQELIDLYENGTFVLKTVEQSPPINSPTKIYYNGLLITEEITQYFLYLPKLILESETTVVSNINHSFQHLDIIGMPDLPPLNKNESGEIIGGVAINNADDAFLLCTALTTLCSSLNFSRNEGILDSLDLTHMFLSCSSLRKIPTIIYQSAPDFLSYERNLILENTFDGCFNLLEIKIQPEELNSTLDQFSKIDLSNSFENCNNLIYCTILGQMSGAKIKIDFNLLLPEEIFVRKGAFENCNSLRKIVTDPIKVQGDDGSQYVDFYLALKTCWNIREIPQTIGSGLIRLDMVRSEAEDEDCFLNVSNFHVKDVKFSTNVSEDYTKITEAFRNFLSSGIHSLSIWFDEDSVFLPGFTVGIEFFTNHLRIFTPRKDIATNSEELFINAYYVDIDSIVNLCEFFPMNLSSKEIVVGKLFTIDNRLDIRLYGGTYSGLNTSLSYILTNL